MKKRLLSALLALSLALTPALAAGEDKFPAVNVYPGYADVPAGSWFASAAQVCYEAGLMTGTDAGFQPDRVLTVGECAAIAARMRETLTGEAIPAPVPDPGTPWYQHYLDYMRAADPTLTPLLAHPEEASSRMQYLLLLDAALPQGQDLLPPINAITALPDTDDPVVLTFYNAGILTGVDDYGTFAQERSLTRAECAAMVARVVRPALRKTFTPQTPADPPSDTPADAPLDPAQEANQTTALWVNGKAIPASQYVGWLNRVMYSYDQSLYNQARIRLLSLDDAAWAELDGPFKDDALQAAIRYALLTQQAKALGCTTDTLAQTLTPNPGREALSAYAQGMDYLAAKHILILTTDPATGKAKRTDADAQALAQSIADALNQSPTTQQFENLLSLYNEDPGMVSCPEGYLFSKGEMVAEFEAAVRALDIGGYTTQPVKSSYGYHVILRLDPADLAQTRENYQSTVLTSMVNTWTAESTITPNQALIDMISPKGCYQLYLQGLAARQG